MLPSRLPLTFVLTVMPLTAVLLLATMSTPAYASCATETGEAIATEDDGFLVSSCVVAEVSEPFVDRLRPEATRRPVVAGATGVERNILDGTTGITLALGLLASLCLVAWLAYRRFGAGARTRGS